MQITHEVTIAMGHRLARHEGKCFNYHGHNYKIQVTVRATGPLGETGMVMDFSELKAALKTVLAPYDHAMVLEEGDAMLPFLVEGRFKHITTEFPPTAEMLARHWKLRLCDWLARNEDTVFVGVMEMPDSGASA